MSSDARELARQLASGDAAQARAAAEALMLLREDAAPAAVALVEAVASTDEATREHAAAALEELGAPAAGDCDALAKLLRSDNADSAYWAATLLGRLEDDAAGTTDALAEVLDDESRAIAVRERSAWALGRIGKSASIAADALRRAAASSSSARLASLADAALTSVVGQGLP